MSHRANYAAGSESSVWTVPPNVELLIKQAASSITALKESKQAASSITALKESKQAASSITALKKSKASCIKHYSPQEI